MPFCSAPNDHMKQDDVALAFRGDGSVDTDWECPLSWGGEAMSEYPKWEGNQSEFVLRYI